MPQVRIVRSRTVRFPVTDVARLRTILDTRESNRDSNFPNDANGVAAGLHEYQGVSAVECRPTHSSGRRRLRVDLNPNNDERSRARIRPEGSGTATA